MKIASTTLPQRIELLADGRTLYPWAKRIGVNKGSIEKVMKLDGGLSGETLACFHRTENVRTDWLLEGHGAPFYVSARTNDEDAAELLDEYLEEHWTITLVTDGRRLLIVLSQPGSFDVKDGKDSDGHQVMRRVEYTIVEVIAAPIGKATITRLKRGRKTFRVVTTTPERFSAIEKGNVGTYRLFEAPDAILSTDSIEEVDEQFFSRYLQPELFPATPDENALLGNYRTMTPENRLAVAQVANAMADYATTTKK
ncbi:hypothetical protein [Herminiimonas contaminans]|uniref:Uncharacterized protein n=1 Tax=Herminiimonas contaminans TaxID=1111140 RepID=A0ABS0EQ13_9BURK|nr:hypothetical protein [Herminiimonas contaminans]MBF8176937.1 hypothetical protein [Herminiimonas contaminans]